MGKVVSQLAMSLDGFIADQNDGCDELFGFYGGGNVAVKMSEGFPELRVSQVTADLLNAAVEQIGATVVGRRLYDITNGWNGHPGGEVPMVVLTHNPPADWPRGGVPISFVSGAEAAVAKAQELAGGKDVSIAGATATRSGAGRRTARRDRRQSGPGDLGEGYSVVRRLEGAGAVCPTPRCSPTPGSRICAIRS